VPPDFEDTSESIKKSTFIPQIIGATGNPPTSVIAVGTAAADAWGHFQIHELQDPDVGRSASTIYGYLDYFKNQILPRWGKAASMMSKPSRLRGGCGGSIWRTVPRRKSAIT
jgi:hypothetical protein